MRILTGIQASGKPHLGNILGAIMPAVELSKQPGNDSFLFIADLHTLTSLKDGESIRSNTLSIAAAWLAFGFNTVDGYFQTTAGIDLAIEVTSPAGTKSVLLSSKQALIYPALTEDLSENPGYILHDSVFLTNAFYGENAKGTWTVKVLDAGASDYASSGGLLGVDGYVNNTDPSVIEGVAIRVFGR